MLDFDCALCSEKLEKPGAILFGPPKQPGQKDSPRPKYHICTRCYGQKLQLWLGDCVACSEEPEQLAGAIISSPPEQGEASKVSMVRIYYVCTKCYEEKFLPLLSEEPSE